MSRWSTIAIYSQDCAAEPVERPIQPVYLDAFALDVTEVTNAAFAEFVADGGAAPPSRCGYLEKDQTKEESETATYFEELSGWTDAGTPEAGMESRPVVCVTRAEAAAYCRRRGGRLPTAAELMRAARPAIPDLRRFPWGEGPPWPDEVNAYVPDIQSYAPVGYGLDGSLRSQDVGTAALGAGAEGVLDLAGNASEYVLDCKEDLDATYGPLDSPSVRPTAAARADCSQAVLCMGTNWRSTWFPQYFSAQSLFEVRDGEDSVRYIEPMIDEVPADTFNTMMWGSSKPIVPDAGDGHGNLRRSWRIGFRCAYDLLDGGT